MSKEILAIPEDKLEEVIVVIRVGLRHLAIDERNVSQETINQLRDWCDKEEKYINERTI